MATHGEFKLQSLKQLQFIHRNQRVETYKGYSPILKEWLCLRFPKNLQGSCLILQQISLLRELASIEYIEKLVPELPLHTIHYLATYWIEGCTSAHLMKQSHISLEKRIQWISALAETIQALHNANIIHADLQPENILISKDHPFLIDFELAFQLNQNPCYTFGGTGSYMSPEVRLGKMCDKQSEQYTFAILSYEWIVWDFCFGYPNLLRLPIQLRLPFQRALQADPFHRFPSVILFTRELCSAWSEFISCDK